MTHLTFFRALCSASPHTTLFGLLLDQHFPGGLLNHLSGRVSRRRRLAAVAGPIGMEKLSAQLVGPFVRMRPEKIALGLEQIGVQPCPTVAIKKRERARFGQHRDPLQRRHAPPGGLGGFHFRAEERIQQQILQDRRLEFFVVDNGRGIPMEELPHILDRYYKSRDSGGSGLGLAIVKRLVEAHGGTIEARSEAGKGTTIRFWIPM